MALLGGDAKAHSPLKAWVHLGTQPVSAWGVSSWRCGCGTRMHQVTRPTSCQNGGKLWTVEFQQVHRQNMIDRDLMAVSCCFQAHQRVRVGWARMKSSLQGEHQINSSNTMQPHRQSRQCQGCYMLLQSWKTSWIGSNWFKGCISSGAIRMVPVYSL